MAAARALEAAKPRLFSLLQKSLRDPVAAKALALKLLNLCLAKRHFLAGSTELISRPPGLVVDPSNACNLACPGCVHSGRAKDLRLFDWKPGLIQERSVAAFFRSFGPSAIQGTLCNYGEPLVHPETPKFIRMAKRYLMHTMLSTNLALPRYDAAAYVESGLDYMVLSIDGATQAVYERFRRKGDLGLVYENIRKLVAAREKLGRSTPVIAWRFLAFEHNAHEIPAAIEKAREFGLDQFRADPAWDIGWDDPAIRPASIQPLSVEFRSNIQEVLAANWNPFPREPDRDPIEREFDRNWEGEAEASSAFAPGPSCEWLYKSITLDAGGRIFPCCCAPTPKKDLHFAQWDEDHPRDGFNSEKHKMARLFFGDAARYRAQRDASGLKTDPYCVRCEWDKTADPSPGQIRQYFDCAVPGLFDRRTLDLLATW